MADGQRLETAIKRGEMTDNSVHELRKTSPSQIARYLVRKESGGAVAFDTIERRVFRLNNETLALLSGPGGRQNGSRRVESVRVIFR